MATSEKIKQAAAKLLTTSKVNKAPVNVQELAKKLGISVNYEPFKEDLSGVLVKEQEKTVIGVNSTHPKTRQRFTIAHELGHFALKHHGELFVDKTVMKRDGRSSQAIDPHEMEANSFAAELLMPSELLLKSVERRLDGKTDYSAVDLISDLANEFEVSTQAMEYRLTNLGIYMPQ